MSETPFTYEKRERILIAALTLALKDGFSAITRERVAKLARVSTGTINTQWRSMDNLRDEIIREAARGGHLGLVGEAIALRYKAALALSPDVKKKAIEAIDIR